MRKLTCRFCGNELKQDFIDLGTSPLANSYIRKEHLQEKEIFYPLHVYVCDSCFLVQLEEFEQPQNIFGNYAYFSSYSETWLKHAKEYTEMIIPLLNLTSDSSVVEVASNDGYLLHYFKNSNIPVLGIEPAANIAEIALKKGIPTLVDFFSKQLATQLVQQGKQADLIIANNVLAHVPDLNDFVAGLSVLLKPEGVISVEFPHLLKLIQNRQFDTIYHEHFSYFSFITVQDIFESYGLKIFDVEELSTHGGSLRVYACHGNYELRQSSSKVVQLLESELEAGLSNIDTYQDFSEQVGKLKRKILSFFIQIKESGKTIVGYGAPAKGNTLLNYCGIRTDFLDFTVDLSPYKQGLYLPGTHIPIVEVDRIKETKPDYIVILPWNLKDEITQQISYIRGWGGKFVTLIPEVVVF